MYKISCANCLWCYNGETASFQHQKCQNSAKGFRIANHTRSQDHAFDFGNPSIIDKGGFRTGKALEVWHTKLPVRKTIHVHYLENITFFLTNIHNY